MGKIFQFMVFTFLGNALNLCIFTHASVNNSKLQIESFENLFFRMTEGVKEAIIFCIKIQSENMKMTWNISLFIFCMIFNFFKLDGFAIL